MVQPASKEYVLTIEFAFENICHSLEYLLLAQIIELLRVPQVRTVSPLSGLGMNVKTVPHG